MPNLRRRCFLIVCGLVAGLQACSNATHQSVEWYQQHDNERATKLKWCTDDTARRTAIDCQNAVQAMLQNQADPAHQVHPPMNWGPPTASPPPPPTNK